MPEAPPLLKAGWCMQCISTNSVGCYHSALCHSPGCVEVCIMHPLDLVKTRIQIQSTTPAAVAGGATAAVESAHYRVASHCEF